MAQALQREGDILVNFQRDPSGAILGVANQIVKQYTGMRLSGDGFDQSYLISTYGGLAAGVAGHMVANRLGVNKQMKRIPMLGKYVQL